ncbi:hypothetical protein GALMADRAFT_67161 [Galerina marginata CBS 339.88]|uniref:HMG domain-containing protein n=1 Tax=Galerina marginata (strain CBS 339.88) TaxID=685588 RepID=A0A067T0P3_GALM3|nr:hypothetical protein GALMADRAFT_67161 [Galerina marginata CBS 339.88]
MEYSTEDVQNGITLNDEAYEYFVEAVQAEECGFWQLSKTLFIANGWDIRTNTPTPLWYHLTRVKTANGQEIACFCPEARVCTDCLHIRFLQIHGPERFPYTPETAPEDDQTILFSRYWVNVMSEGEEEPGKTYRNLFSVFLPGLSASAKTRVVVEHDGDDTGSGHWACFKHPNIRNCEHIIAARDCLQRYITGDKLARDTLIERDYLLYNGKRRTESISYRPIPPAVWARLPSDPVPVRQFLEKLPNIIPLCETSSCCCNPGARLGYDSTKPVNIVECTVYGIARTWKTTIEIQKCPSCKHRYIGPDCCEIGIFNWNNRSLFMHDLLEDYISSYTSSETPIHSWVLTVSRRYQSHNMEFVGEKKFLAAWFAYARLLELDGDMNCPKCGPSPRATIWDGVTLAFTWKNILPSLRPPTYIHPDAPQRSEIRYPVNPQCIPDKELRKSITAIFIGQ